MMYPRDFSSESDLNALPILASPIRKVKGLGGCIYGKVFVGETSSLMPGASEACVVKAMSKAKVWKGSFGLENAQSEINCALFLRDIAGPYNVKCRGAAQDETNFYLCTEYCEHGELFGILDTVEGNFSEAVLREIMLQVFSAVKVLQDNGIVHRDISLENFFVRSNGQVCLGDYGQAIRVHDLAAGEVREEAQLRLGFVPPGKVAYRAPELYRGYGAAYSGKAIDVFACGVVLYALAVKSQPFKKAVPSYLFPAHNQHPDLSRCGKLRGQLDYIGCTCLSDGLVDLLERLLAPGSADRISIDEALRHPWLEGIFFLPGPAAAPAKGPTGKETDAMEDMSDELSTDACSVQDVDVDSELSPSSP